MRLLRASNTRYLRVPPKTRRKRCRKRRGCGWKDLVQPVRVLVKSIFSRRWLWQNVHVTNSILRILILSCAYELAVLADSTQNKEERIFASAEHASEKSWRILCDSKTNTWRRSKRTKHRKGCSRASKARRRNVVHSVFFYEKLSFPVADLWRKAHICEKRKKNAAFRRRAPESRAHQHVICTCSNTKRKRILANPECASREDFVHLVVSRNNSFFRSRPWQKAHEACSLSTTHQNRALTNTRFFARLPAKSCLRAPKA